MDILIRAIENADLTLPLDVGGRYDVMITGRYLYYLISDGTEVHLYRATKIGPTQYGQVSQPTTVGCYLPTGKWVWLLDHATLTAWHKSLETDHGNSNK